jgi:hypothetical protein
MKLAEFPEHNIVFAKDQLEYTPLPAHRLQGDEYGTIAFCWKPSWKERLAILFGKPLWHEVLTFNQPLQPQRLSTDKPMYLEKTK